MLNIRLLRMRRAVAGVVLLALTPPLVSVESQQSKTASLDDLQTLQTVKVQAEEPVLSLAKPVSWQLLRDWFELRDETLTLDQRIKLWQTLAELINLYAHPDFAQFERYLRQRGGYYPHAERDPNYSEAWREQYRSGGAWTQIRGRGTIEVFVSEQPVADAMQYMQQHYPSPTCLVLGRAMRYPGEEVRPCLYARVCFTAVPPDPPAPLMEDHIPKVVNGQLEWEVRLAKVDASPRVYCLWLRWDYVAQHWWLDVVGINNAYSPRPRNYDLMF
jgi:hypothetical protein